MSEQTIEKNQSSTSELGGRYLSFNLGETFYAVTVSRVREIIRTMDVTRVPQTPAFIRGVMNLRGKIVPVLTLRTILGMESVEDTDDSRVIVIEVGSAEVGVTVDSVHEVATIKDEEIGDPPEFGEQIKTEFVLGMGTVGGEVTILLDFDRALESTLASPVVRPA
jgi:purine-binding chemotaxis protein CheW